MEKLLSDVASFHRACDLPVIETPTLPSPDRALLRIRLIKEECDETLSALYRDDLVELADGLADLIYVCVGTALEYGIPLDLVWNAVQRANMTKVDPATGKVLKREDGKVLKPLGWTPPDIKSIIEGEVK